MTHKYLISVCLSALAFCFMVGCNNNVKPDSKDSNNTAANAQNSEQLVEPEISVNDAVDWDMPVFELEANGDTIKKYAYRIDGKLIADYDYYENKPVYYHTYEYDGNGNLITITSFYDGNEIGMDTRSYDEQNRILKREYGEESDSGEFEYSYVGNKCIEVSESALSEVVFRDVTETYYDENGNDTLIVNNTARVREHTDADYNPNVETVVYKTRKTYVTINGVSKLKSSLKKEMQKDNVAIVRDQDDYEYDNFGRVITYKHYDDFGDGCPVTDEKFTYTYSENCRIDQNGNKVYYKVK